MKKSIRKKLCAVTLAAGFALASIGVPEVSAKDRGNSGLPPGPGNPIAQVYKMVLELQEMINAIAPQEGDLWIDHIGFNSNNLDLALLNDGSGGLDVTLISPAISASAVLATGLQVPPGFDVQKVIVCYQATGATVGNVQVNQFLTASSTVATPINSALSPVAGSCYESAAATTNIDPSLGPLTLNINANFSAATDELTILGIAIHLVPKI